MMKKRLLLVLGSLLLAGLGVVLYLKLEGTGPAVSMEGLDAAVRAAHDLRLNVSDPESGIRSVNISLVQGEKTAVLFDESYPAINFIVGGEVFDKSLAVTIEPKKQGLSDGDALLRLIANDYSWRNWWQGNRTVIERPVRIDFRPPRVEVLSRQHNINQGGAGLVVYKLSEACPEHGVQVGDNFFQGYALAGDPEGRLACLFALDYRQGKGTEVFLSAKDSAGNQSKAGFYHHIRAKKFKKDLIRLSDGFLARKMPEFEYSLSGTPPATPVDKFLSVNQDLRRANAEAFQKMTRDSEGTLYWTGPFLRLPNAARKANFADHREYQYQGKTIDRQVHVGIDLASLAHAPVPAGNSGKVIFTGPVGIYGETVAIDHGLGLFSTYSHLSSIQVEAGQMVSRGDIIGNTGATGLAGGDHLHYGMLVGGVFVNPVEWWDPAWIQNNITLKLNAAE
jgi:murein DD-endopeptidase MepM/ murein hydrolase activator NlpD